MKRISKLQPVHNWTKLAPTWRNGVPLATYLCSKCGTRVEGKHPSSTARCFGHFR